MKAQLGSQFSSAEDSPGFLLWKVANLHQRLQRRALADLMLTPTQFSVLACYEELATTRPALPTQKDVCDYAALEKMLVSDATRALIKSKLLSAKPNETDRRANSINLTPKGRTTLKNAIAIVEKLDQQLFADTTSLVRELRSILAASATESSKG